MDNFEIRNMQETDGQLVLDIFKEVLTGIMQHLKKMFRPGKPENQSL
jgi:hypothetical protein